MSQEEPIEYKWCSFEGRVRLRGIMEELVPQWRSGPRDFQIDVWAHILDKIPVLLVAQTGGGKTAAFWGPIRILQYLLQHPLGIIPKTPAHPVGIIITPLVELGNNHAREINTEFNLKAVAVNAETVLEASTHERNLYTEIQECKWPIVLISPERLLTSELDGVLRDEGFRKNVVLLGIDEAHVLNPWGREFRPAYKQISQLSRRLPSHCVVVAVTATLSPGKDYNALCASLEFKPGRFHCIRLSSERPNVRTVLAELRSGLTGWTFPDIQWVFKTPGIKAVVYCASLDLELRVALYGWNQHEPGQKRLDHVRLWNSLTSPTYNRRTLDLFQNDPDTRVIVASVAFGLGMNIHIISDSINLGVPDTVEALVQQNGRAGRDLEMEARGWTYIEPAVVALVQGNIDRDDDREGAGDSGTKNGKTKRVVDEKVKEVVAAHLQGECINVKLNVLLGNPGNQERLPCEAAQRRLPCSSCRPFWNAENAPSPAQMPPGFVLPVDPSSIPVDNAPKSRLSSVSPPVRLTKKYRIHAQQMLTYFAEARALVKATARSRYAPVSDFWSGVDLDLVLDNIHLLRAKEMVESLLSGWHYLKDDGHALFLLLEGLNAQYDAHRLQAKEGQVLRAAATRAANKGAVPVHSQSRCDCLNNMDAIYIYRKESQQNHRQGEPPVRPVCPSPSKEASYPRHPTATTTRATFITTVDHCSRVLRCQWAAIFIVKLGAAASQRSQTPHSFDTG